MQIKAILLAVDGSDRRIAERARLSYDRNDAEGHQRLVEYLLENWHTGPFEFCSIQFEVHAPLAIVQQLLRHRTFKFNQLSMRYVAPPEDDFFPDAWRVKGGSSKQGSTQAPEDFDQGHTTAIYDEALAAADLAYDHLTTIGVAPEQARFVLPQARFTRIAVAMDLNNAFKYLALRLHPHAQAEHRILAGCVAEHIRQAFPIAYAAFEEYRLFGHNMSRTELETLAMMFMVVEEQIQGYNAVLDRLEEELSTEQRRNVYDAEANPEMLPHVQTINLSRHGSFIGLLRNLGFDSKKMRGSYRRFQNFLDKIGLTEVYDGE